MYAHALISDWPEDVATELIAGLHKKLDRLRKTKIEPAIYDVVRSMVAEFNAKAREFGLDPLPVDARFSASDLIITAPRFRHDCERCRFLGIYDEFDLWVHPKDTEGSPTVIARYGEDAEYVSGLVMIEHHHALQECYRRARYEKLLT